MDDNELKKVEQSIREKWNIYDHLKNMYINPTSPYTFNAMMDRIVDLEIKNIKVIKKLKTTIEDNESSKRVGPVAMTALSNEILRIINKED